MSATGRVAPPVTIRTLDDLADLDAACRLFDTLWQRSTPAVPTELLRALTHAGNYAVGAYEGPRLVGAGMGFLGRHEGRECLHSHIVGVLPDAQGRGVGLAIKQHQRRWAQAAGIPTITWTFDPLVRRNAVFNLARLGATAVAYHADFYGRMDDGFNADSETDRLLVAWPSDPGDQAPPVPEDPAPAETLVGVDDRGAPVPAEVHGPVVRCHVPADIVALRRADPVLGRAWRLTLRDALGGTLATGGRILTATRDGWYLLRRPTA